ncbi:hypothetical protein V2J09_008961 [Rumex salicifolius]
MYLYKSVYHILKFIYFIKNLILIKKLCKRYCGISPSIHITQQCSTVDDEATTDCQLPNSIYLPVIRPYRRLDDWLLLQTVVRYRFVMAPQRRRAKRLKTKETTSATTPQARDRESEKTGNGKQPKRRRRQWHRKHEEEEEREKVEKANN